MKFRYHISLFEIHLFGGVYKNDFSKIKTYSDRYYSIVYSSRFFNNISPGTSQYQTRTDANVTRALAGEENKFVHDTETNTAHSPLAINGNYTDILIAGF